MAVHPNSLKNLKSILPGVSGNPNGRPSAGLSLIEWLNELVIEDESGKPRYSLDDLNGFADDGAGSHTKAIASEMIILARARGFDEYGKPMCAKMVDMICDRTRGKPLQSVEVTRPITSNPAELLAASAAMLAESPELRALIAAQGAHPMIDVDAIALPEADNSED